MAKIRAFIACDIPEGLLKKTSDIQDKLKKLDAEVSWTRIDGIHITLKFLGDIEQEIIERVADVIEEATTGQPPFEICIKGSGAFPNLKNPRVIWIGVEDLNKGLMHIQQALDGRLKALGFEPEEREFRPHLTLGRVKGFEPEEREFRPHLTLGRVKGAKGKERLSSAISGLKDIEIGSFTVDRVILYKSELKPAGAVYTKLREVFLQKT